MQLKDRKMCYGDASSTEIFLAKTNTNTSEIPIYFLEKWKRHFIFVRDRSSVFSLFRLFASSFEDGIWILLFRYFYLTTRDLLKIGFRKLKPNTQHSWRWSHKQLSVHDMLAVLRWLWLYRHISFFSLAHNARIVTFIIFRVAASERTFEKHKQIVPFMKISAQERANDFLSFLPE